MKKLIVILLCVAVIIGVGIGIVYKTKDSRLNTENILPQNVFLYTQLDDVAKNIKELASMSIWQGLSNINFEALIEKSSLNAQQGIFLDLIKNQLADVLNNPVAKRIFGHEVALAIYPPNKDLDLLVESMKTLNPKAIEDLLSGLFLVTRLEADVQFVEFASRFFSQFGSKVSQGQVEYKGEIIRSIILTDVGIRFGIVRIEDLLVIGIGETAARASVDVYKRDQKSLAEDSQFQKVRNRFLKPSSAAGYINFAKFVDEFQKQKDNLLALAGETAGGVDMQDQWDEALSKMAGFKAFSFSSQLNPIPRIDSHILFDPGKLDADYAPLYTCPPDDNKTIHFTPQDVLGYFWSNCIKLDHYWGQMVKEMERANVPASKVDEFEVNSGMSVKKDILPAFGEEIGGYIQDIQVGGLFPTPKLLLFIEVGEKPKMESLLSKLEEQPLVMFQEENYNNTLIKYLGLPMGEGMQPGYAFFNNYLLISTSRKLIKDSVDASQNASLSLQADASFKEINFGLTDKNKNVQFLKLGQLIEKTKGIIGWSNKWMTAQDQKKEAFKTGSARPLEEVKKNIALKEGELDEIRNLLILVEDEIWNFQTKGLDVGAKQAELNELQQQLDAKKEEIVIENERKEGLAGIVKGFDQKTPDSNSRQFYLDNIIYPLLDSFRSIQTFGLRGTIDGDIFESSIFFKIAE